MTDAKSICSRKRNHQEHLIQFFENTAHMQLESMMQTLNQSFSKPSHNSEKSTPLNQEDRDRGRRSPQLKIKMRLQLLKQKKMYEDATSCKGGYTFLCGLPQGRPATSMAKGTVEVGFAALCAGLAWGRLKCMVQYGAIGQVHDS